MEQKGILSLPCFPSNGAKYHLKNDPIITPIFKTFDNLPLPEKDEKEGGDFGGDKESEVEETKGCHGDHEESDDQRNQNISNQSVFDGNSNHKAISLKN